ncbi:MAG: MmcQ/YjbR family DNA-binding protein [Pseudomonadota bacterium]
MTRATVDAICAGLPGAHLPAPESGELEAWKLGGKMFACLAGGEAGVSVKTDSIETAEMLIAAGVGERAPYFHRSWIRLPLDAPEAELRHRIETSYRLIRAGLPRKMLASLAPFE